MTLKQLILVFGLILPLAMLPSSTSAAEEPTPTKLIGGKIVSVDEAKALLDQKSAAFFDMRNILNYGKGHIPTGTALPYKGESENKPDFDSTKDKLDLSKLPASKNAKVVFYSDGPTGWKSYKAAVIAIKAGYSNVMWLREGYAGWVAKGYGVAQ
jgi:rhodanese-related sulfurtransferase